MRALAFSSSEEVADCESAWFYLPGDQENRFILARTKVLSSAFSFSQLKGSRPGVPVRQRTLTRSSAD